MLYRDQLAASLSRLRAERALSTPATPAPTPTPHPGQVLTMLLTILREEMCSHMQILTIVIAQGAAHHQALHPDAILDSLARLPGGGDEGICSRSIKKYFCRNMSENINVIVLCSSAPGTPAPTPYSPSPGHQLDPGQVAASIAKLREEVGA